MGPICTRRRPTLTCDPPAPPYSIGYGGKQRFRVVTLAGELIDASGAMSGGGGRVAKGGMGQSVASITNRPDLYGRWGRVAEGAGALKGTAGGC